MYSSYHFSGEIFNVFFALFMFTRRSKVALNLSYKETCLVNLIVTSNLQCYFILR
jgi:hypothetical protein